MAYVLVYEQNFAAGNSTFSQTDVYHRQSHGTESATGADPLYPDAYEAETVRVRSGRGPAGEATLDWYNSPTSGGDDYTTSGFWAKVPTAAAPGTGALATVYEGLAAVDYMPNATSSGFGTIVDPLLYLFKYDGGAPGAGYSLSNALFWLTMEKDFSTGGVRKLRLQYYDWWDGSIDEFTHTNAQPNDVWWTYQVEFKEPTYVGDEPNTDGYIRVYENATAGVAGTGTLVYEHTSARIQTNGQLGADRGLISGYAVGYAGLWGEVTNIRIYSLAAVTPPAPAPVDDESVGCCSDTPGTVGAVGAVPEDPTEPTEAWTALCSGGGAVPIAAAPPSGEAWP